MFLKKHITDIQISQTDLPENAGNRFSYLPNLYYCYAFI